MILVVRQLVQEHHMGYILSVRLALATEEGIKIIFIQNLIEHI